MLVWERSCKYANHIQYYFCHFWGHLEPVSIRLTIAKEFVFRNLKLSFSPFSTHHVLTLPVFLQVRHCSVYYIEQIPRTECSHSKQNIGCWGGEIYLLQWPQRTIHNLPPYFISIISALSAIETSHGNDPLLASSMPFVLADSWDGRITKINYKRKTSFLYVQGPCGANWGHGESLSVL